jgi:RHS repeat-associated protein
MEKDRSELAVTRSARARRGPGWRVSLSLVVCALLLAARPADAGTLTNLSPTGASAGISVKVNGTGFDTTAGNHQILLTPPAGSPVTVTPTAGAVVDAAKGVRSLTFKVPAGLMAGAVAIRVTNTVTGEVSEGQSLQIVDLSLPAVVSAPRGAAAVVVRITGTPNAQFVAGPTTRVTMGAGVTVTSTIVDSPTSLRATIDVAAAATLGARTIAITTPTQLLTLANGFLVTESGGTPNQAPTARPGGPYNGAVAQMLTFNGSASSDPDAGDTLTYAWSFGDNTAAGSGATVQHAYQAAGTFPLALTVTDSKGATHTAATTVTIVNAGPTNRPPVAAPGGPYSGQAGRAIAFDGSASSDPDGDTISYAWNFGDGPETAAGVRVEHIYQTSGAFTATLTVTDAHGESRSATVAVTVSAAPSDETAPFVTLNAPSQALAGSQVTVTALATDNVGVVRVQFLVNGADPTDDETPPYERVLVIPAGATPGTTFTVRAIASDLAGNTGAREAVITVAATPDTTDPTIALNAPPHASPSATVRLAATAADNVGVASVTFLAGGQTIATVTQPPYEATYTIPANAAVGSTIAIVARAADLSGHTAQDSADITIVQAPDTAAPTIELSAPPQIGAGRTLVFSAIAADNVGVASVQFFVDDVLVATDTQAPYDALFPVAADTASGVVLKLRARAVDYAGNDASDSETVAVLGNQPPAANAGGPYTVQVGDLLAFNGAASSDPDGDALTYAWTFGDNASGTGPSPSHAYAAAGAFTVTLTVSDGRGGSAQASAQVTVTPVADRAAPAITLSGPSRVLPGTQVTVIAQVTDNVGVSDVTFTINGATPTVVSAAPFTRVVTVPAVAAPGTTLVVQGMAKDAAGNGASAQHTLTITASPDTQAPVVSLRLPERTSAGATLIVGANATDDSGVRAVTFYAGTTMIGVDDAAPYEAVWTVPAGTAAGTTLPFTARATDFSDNVADATGTVTVAAAGDTTPPTVSLTAPATVAAGGTLRLTATAQDEGGISAVEFYLDGVRIASDASAPYQVDYALPAGRLPGALLRLQARAVDFAGLDATAIAESRVTAAGKGVIAGEVFDATTGLPLAEVSITLAGQDAQGRVYNAVATSDAHGRYLIRAEEGEGRLQIAKAGWTTVVRAVPVTTGRAVQPIDARLTPLAPATLIQPVAGGFLAQDGHEATLPGGGVSAPTSLQLTPIGAQALQALLPGGWSPLAALDLAPRGVTFGMPVAIRAPQTRQLPVGSQILLARFDEPTMTWRAVAVVPIAGDGRMVAGEITQTGQYAWLLPDSFPLAPSMPAAGLVVEGVEIAPLPEGAVTVINPQPRVLFYQPGVRSIVSGSITHAQPLSSGIVLRSRISEEYRFFSGAEARPEPYAADIVLYQTEATGKTLAASYPVTPSLPFEALSLKEGVIGVEAYAPPPAQDDELPIIGAEGGSATASTGERLDLPPGAIADAVPFRVERLSALQLGMTLPSGVTLAGGVSLAFSGELSVSGSISVARPADLPAGSRVLFARIDEIAGESRFLLTGVGRIDGDRLVSDVIVPGSPLTLTGVRRAGRYVFLRIASPVAFFTGTVLGVNDSPFASALVTSDKLPLIVSQSAADGRYLAAVLTGAATLTARDLAKNDTGSAEGSIPQAWSVATLGLRLVAQRPGVTSVSPGANAASVPLSTPVVVKFSEPIDPATLAGTGGQRITLTGPAGLVASTVTLSGNDTIVTLRPLAALTQDATYTVAVNQAITDLSGYTLSAAVNSTFATLKTSAPAPLPAGQIRASIPVNGQTTVSASAGTANPHDQLLIVNKRTGVSVPAVVNPDGSFSASIAALLTDKLEIHIIDQAGNVTIVQITGYRDQDGRTAVGPEGGTLETTTGLRLSIKPGTFPEGSIVKFTALAPDAVNPTVPVGSDYPLVAGFEIDSSAAPQHYMNVSFPAPAGVTSTSTGIVAEVVQVYGQRANSIVDTAKIIDGRLATSSPPCEGIVNKFGRYAMYLNDQQQMRLGIALLSMSVPTTQSVVLQPVVLTNPYLPYPPTILFEGMQFEQMYYPATPFISYIRRTGDVAGGLDMADNSRPVCFPVPPDQQMRVVVRDGQTGAVIQSVQQTAPAAGQIATIDTIYVAPGDTQAPTVLWTSWSRTRPYVLDAGKPIQVQFSEAVSLGAAPGLDPAYLLNQLTGARLTVDSHVAADGRTVTFVPRASLAIGTDFLLRLPGLRDLSGNAFTGALSFRTFEPVFVMPSTTPAGPSVFTRSRILNDLTFAGITPPASLQSVALNDIDYVTWSPEESQDGQWHTWLYGIGNAREFGFQILSIDASQPRQPAAVGMSMGGQRFYGRMKVLRDIALRFRDLPTSDTRGQALETWKSRELHYLRDNPSDRICGAPNDPRIAAWRDRRAPGAVEEITYGGCGTLGLVTSHNTYYAILHIYDVTNPAATVLLAQRLLTDGGSIAGYPRKKEAPAVVGGVSRGVDVLAGVDFTHGALDSSNPSATWTHENATAAFVAVYGSGIEAVDLAFNVPELDYRDRPPGGTAIESLQTWTFPYYQDLALLRQRVVAVAGDQWDNSGTAHLEVFDAGLQPIGNPVPLPVRPYAMTVAPGLVRVDADGDDQPEDHDFALVSGRQGLAMVEIASDGSATLTGFVPMPSAPRTSEGLAVSNTTGMCPTVKFWAGSEELQVYVDGSTTFYRGVCESLALGARVSIVTENTAAGIRAKEVTFLDAPALPLVDQLRQVQVDKATHLAYVAGTWKKDAATYEGFVVIDVSNPYGGHTDRDGDGWDDRIRGFFPVSGPGTPIASARVNGFRIDERRKLIYAALDGEPKDAQETNLAILRTCECVELDANVTLKSGGFGLGDPRPSADGTTATIYVTPEMLANGQFSALFDVKIIGGGDVHYTITEYPVSGLDADRMFDLSQGGTGTLAAGLGRINLGLRPLGEDPRGSVIAVDFTDAEGRFIKRVLMHVIPTAVVSSEVKVRTFMDRTNREMYETPGHLLFVLNAAARVTIRVDGQIIPQQDDSQAPGAPFADVPLQAGLNRVLITRALVPVPGEHEYRIQAVYEEGVQTAQTGKVIHEVVIDESLPVGHTFVKGVDLSDGHLTLGREDLQLATTGPALQFMRTYSSIGNRNSGVMGAGWSHNWESRLTVDGQGRIQLAGGEGAGMRFSQPEADPSFPNAERVFKPQAGYHGRLVYQAGAYDYYTRALTRYHYELAPAEIADPDYRLTFMEDAAGNRLTLTYAGTMLSAVTDASGRSLTFSYEPAGASKEERLKKIEGPMDLVVTYDYDEFGNLTKATRGERVEQYAYSVGQAKDRYNLTSVTDPNGHRTDYGYYADGDSFPGEQASFEWGRDILIIPMKYELVKSVTEGADDPAVAAKTTFAYDYSQLGTRYLTTVTDPRNIVTRYVMHARGAVTEVRVALPGGGENVTTQRWAFEDNINDVYITRKVDPNGRVTRFEYDTRGNTTKEIIEASIDGYAPVADAGGNVAAEVVTSWEYEPKFNQLVKKTDPEGHVTSYVIDPANGLVLSRTTTPGGSAPAITTHYTYGDSPTRNGKQLRSLLKTTKDPLGRETSYLQYDEQGNPTKIQDAENHVTTQVFDLRGRLTESSDTMGHHAVTGYDGLDRTVSTKKFAGNQPADPSMQSDDQDVTVTWFPGGQKRIVTDGLGHETEFEYDSLNRPRKQTDRTVDADASPITLTATWQYDGNGNRLVEIDRRGTERHFAYDGLNRLTTVSVKDANGALKTVSEQQYDAAGNVTADIDLHKHRTGYDLDALYRRVKVNLPVTPYAVEMTYDLVGNELRVTDANGKATTRTFDGTYRVLTQTDPTGHVVRYAYDANGNVLTETHDRTGVVRTNGPFDGANRLLASTLRFTDPVTSQAVTYTTETQFLDDEHAVITTNPRGIKVKQVLNGLDKPIARIVDPDGPALTTTFRYDANGNQTALRDPEGDEADIVRTFDGLNRKIVSEYPLGGVERTWYDGNGNPERTVDRRGITMRHEYDALDRKTADILVESISNGGADLELSRTVYDDETSTTMVTDAKQQPTTTQFDGLHHERLITDALGQKTQMDWDGQNKRRVVTPRGLKQEYDYDAINRPTAVREFETDGALKTSMSTEYQDAALRQIETDRRGAQRILQFDQVKRLRRVSKKDAGLAAGYGAAEFVAEEFRYDGNGNILESLDANGRVTSYTYDPVDRRATMIEAAGTPAAATTTFGYDRAGNLLTVKDGRPHGGAFDAQYTYDARNRRLTQTDGAGNVTAYTYTQDNQVETETEPGGGGRTTRYAYDEVGKTLAIDQTRNGAGGVTRFLYDANRNKVAQQDANGSLTTYAYDARNRLTDSYEHTVAGTLADGSTRGAGAGGDPSTALHWHHEYDADGNERRLVDAEGQQITKAYDHLNRLLRKDYSQHRPAADGSVIYPQLVSIVSTMDGNGNATRVEETKRTDATNTVAEVTVMAYDPLNRLTSRTNADNRTLAYGYDRQGNRLSVTDADNVRTTYTYDERNRVATATTEGNKVTAYAWWPDSLPKSTTSPNGMVSEQTYDAADRVTTIVTHQGDASNPISQQDYEYDAAGNRRRQTERHRLMDAGAPQQTTYDYDLLNRLTGVHYPGGASVAYTLAPNGNRLTEVGTDPSSSSAVDREFVYNRVNQVTRIVNRADAAASVAFTYDRNGNTREQRTGTLAGDDVTAPVAVKRFDFDIRDRLRAVVSGAERTTFDYDFTGLRTRRGGPTTVGFLYDEGALLQEYDASSKVTLTKYNYGAGLLSMVSVAATRSSVFYAVDALNSTTALTDESGAVRAGYAYDAFGGLRRSADSTANRRRYTGHYDDTETGLQYFGARYYDPALGRFLSQDAYSGSDDEPPSLHRYAYANGNPLSYVDPTGYRTEGFGQTVEDLGNWGVGLVKGVANAVVTSEAEAASGLITSGVKGLADITMAGVGYLAIEATGYKYTDEIGALLQPESEIGKLAAQKGTVDAITESASGFLKNTAAGIVSLPGRVWAARNSGDPEQLAMTMVEAFQTGQMLKAPLASLAAPAVRKFDRYMAAHEFLARERVSKRGLGKDTRVVTGTLTPQDAWELAGACVQKGARGCGVVGGLVDSSEANYRKNLKSHASVARGDLVPNDDGYFFKYQGDIDFLQYRKDTPYMNNAALADQINQRTSVPMLDTFQAHGVMGEYVPPALIPLEAQQLWWKQQGLTPGSKIRAKDYFSVGVEVPDGVVFRDSHGHTLAPKGNQAFLNKPGKPGVTMRGLERDAFEYFNNVHFLDEIEFSWRGNGSAAVRVNALQNQYEKGRDK